MKTDYKHLLGQKFEWKKQDCYRLVQQFYHDLFDIELPDFARPGDFYQRGLNLFGEGYRDAGFEELRVHPSEYRFGDVFVCAIDSRFGNHCGVFVENNKIAHHLYNRLSEVTHFRGLVRNNCVGVYRHQDVPDIRTNQTVKRDLRDFLPPNKQKVLDELRRAHSGSQGQAD